MCQVSGGRREWKATKHDTIDPETGLAGQAHMDGAQWLWRVYRPGYSGNVASGPADSMSDAKGAAGAALDRAKAATK